MQQAASRTPNELGYRMPAEWEPHEATWLSWPHKEASWPGKFEPVPLIYQELVHVLSKFEKVNILATGAAREQALQLVGDHENVQIHDIPTDDAWMRDHGPTFLVGKQPGLEPALVDWEYNAWGGKYPPFENDNRVPEAIARMLGRKRFKPGIILEGGAIDPNGLGTILTTEECLLNPNRNPHLGREAMETYLRDYLGAEHVLWLGRGIVGDDTDGHIDELARFVGPTTVLAALEEDPNDENFEPLQENFRRLILMKDQQGRPLDVLALPMPKPIYYDGARLPASYANFYIANGVVVVPQFNDSADAYVRDLLADLFPDRQIIGISAVDLVWGLGAFHCITQQQPAILA